MPGNRVGSISHGTLRPCDLIPTFLLELSHRAPGAYAATLDRLESVGTSIHFLNTLISTGLDAHPWWDSDEAGYLMEDLFEALDAVAPDGHYFGSHIGDASDFGYWPHD